MPIVCNIQNTSAPKRIRGLHPLCCVDFDRSVGAAGSSLTRVYRKIGARGFLCDVSQPRRMMDGGLAGFQNSSGVGGGGGGVQPHWKV